MQAGILLSVPRTRSCIFFVSWSVIASACITPSDSEMTHRAPHACSANPKKTRSTEALYIIFSPEYSHCLAQTPRASEGIATHQEGVTSSNSPWPTWELQAEAETSLV